ncbi:MAG: hypothetical protein JWM95_2319 [Gemmatimonadetes bacterium]|nr:hypothetical protein [Gemmatimonadota bacterium]
MSLPPSSVDRVDLSLHTPKAAAILTRVYPLKHTHTYSSLALALTGLLAISCGGSADKTPDPTPTIPTPATPKPGFTFSGAAGTADTVGATLAQPLRVVLRDAAGQPMAGKVVRFTSVRGGTGSAISALAVVVTGTTLEFTKWVTTASDGSIDVKVFLGDGAGAASIAIQMDDSQLYADTARFTALPGNAVSITSAPQDTAIAVGGSYTVTSVVRDRAGNARPDALSYRALDGSITLSAARQVTASTIARSGVIASLGATIMDTARVSVAPTGTMAVRQGATVRVVTLDGRRIADVPVVAGSPNPPLPIPGPEWAPDGQTFYSTMGSQSGDPVSLYRIDLTGARTMVGTCSYAACPKGTPAFVIPGGFASFSPSGDGRFLYLSGGGCNYMGILYQAQTGSSSAPQRLSPANADDCFNTIHRWPSISPDGTVVAFENDSTYFGGFTIQFLDVATRSMRPLRLAGQRPRWSPSGVEVAFVNGSAVWLVRLDGTGLRKLTTSNRQYLPGVTWSPDGRWVLAHASVNGRPMVIVVDAQTGLELPLAFTSGWLDSENGAPVPAWRPNS